MSTSTCVETGYVRRMVELESRCHGDQMNAISRVSRRLGIGESAVRRLMNGDRKTFAVPFLQRIRSAYLDLCESQVRKLQDEIATVRLKQEANDDLQDIGAAALALAERIQAAKQKGL